MRHALVLSLVLSFGFPVIPAPLGDRSDGEEEEIRGRVDWFYRQRGFFDEGADPRVFKEKRDRAARELQARLAASGNMLRSSWTPIGPAPMNMLNWLMGPVAGRLTAVAIDPTSPDTIYVGAAAGGVWKTTDGGGAWTPLFDGQPTQTIGAIAIAPWDPNEIWVGTGDFVSCWGYFGLGVFRSTDGGTSWEERNGSVGSDMPLTHVSSLVLHPTDPDVVLVAGNGIGTPFTDGVAAPGHCGNAAVLDGGIFLTIDGGQSWAKVASGRIHELIRDPSDVDVLYAALPGDGVIKSTDGGASWAPANSGLSVSGDRVEVAISPSDPNVLYALSENRRLYQSNDGAATWSLRNSNACDGQCFYNMTLEVHATDPATLYRGTILPFKSTNGGATSIPLTASWSSAQTVHQDIHVIQRHPTDPATVFIGSDGGLWRSRNGGLTFQNLNGNLNITQLYDVAIHPTRDDIVLGGAQDNSSQHYSGALVWDVSEVTGDGFVNAIHPTDPNYCYISSYYGYLSRSTTGPGGTYSPITSGLGGGCGWLTPYLFDPVDPDVMYAACRGVYKSTSRGSLWFSLGGDLSSDSLTSLAVAPSDPQVIYAGGHDGEIFRTVDGGGSWVDVSTGLPAEHVTRIAVDPSDSQHVFATVSGFSGPHLWVSSTGGAPWTAVTNGLPDVPHNCVILLENPFRIYVGTDVGVFVAGSDAGPYAPDMGGLPQGVVVTDLEFNTVTGTLTAATHGRGAWQTRPSDPPPTADFVGTPRSGTAPLTVAFTNLSSGGATTFSWDFGDGGASSAPDPSHAYTQPGLYDVSLTVTSPFGTDTETKAAYIDVRGGTGMPTEELVTGAGVDAPNPPVVKTFDHSLPPVAVASFTAYGAGGYGVNVAAVDMAAGGTVELATGPGPGAVYGPQIRGFLPDGTAIANVNFYAFGTLRFGAQGAGGDVDGDSHQEILTGPGPGAVFGPHLRGFDYDATQVAAVPGISFYAYSTLRYGARVSGGEMDGDGTFDEIGSGAGAGAVFAPHVRTFDYDAVRVSPGRSFFAFGTGLHGAAVATGDSDGDLVAELIVAHGPDPGADAEVRGFAVVGPVAVAWSLSASAGALGGAEASAGDLDGDGRDEVVATAGWGEANPAVIDAFAISGGGATSLPGFAFDAYPGQAYGAKVAMGDIGI